MKIFRSTGKSTGAVFLRWLPYMSKMLRLRCITRSSGRRPIVSCFDFVLKTGFGFFRTDFSVEGSSGESFDGTSFCESSGSATFVLSSPTLSSTALGSTFASFVHCVHSTPSISSGSVYSSSKCSSVQPPPAVPRLTVMQLNCVKDSPSLKPHVRHLRLCASMPSRGFRSGRFIVLPCCATEVIPCSLRTTRAGTTLSTVFSTTLEVVPAPSPFFSAVDNFSSPSLVL